MSYMENLQQLWISSIAPWPPPEPKVEQLLRPESLLQRFDQPWLDINAKSGFNESTLVPSFTLNYYCETSLHVFIFAISVDLLVKFNLNFKFLYSKHLD